MVGLTEADKELEFSHITNEGEILPSFSCFYNGHPSPNVTWTLFSGEPLPSSIRQNHAKHGILQLQFTSALTYNDPVWFVCTATNQVGTAMARLELVFKGKQSWTAKERERERERKREREEGREGDRERDRWR